METTTALTCDVWPGKNFMFPEKGCYALWNGIDDETCILLYQRNWVAFASYTEIDKITNNKFQQIIMI